MFYRNLILWRSDCDWFVMFCSFRLNKQVSFSEISSKPEYSKLWKTLFLDFLFELLLSVFDLHTADRCPFFPHLYYVFPSALQFFRCPLRNLSPHSKQFLFLRGSSLVVSDLRSENKGSRLESGCSAVIAWLMSKCLWSGWNW